MNFINKIQTLLCCFLMMVFACKKQSDFYETNNHRLGYWNNEKCTAWSNENSRRADSAEVKRILKRYNKGGKIKKENVQKVVFAKSAVKMVEVIGNYKDFKIHEYDYCRAWLIDSTLVVFFTYDSPYAGMIHHDRYILGLKIEENDFESKISFSTDVIGRDGKLAKGDVYYDQLTLNKKSFTAGDTICGKLNIRATFRNRSRLLLKGSFKTIVFDALENVTDKDESARKRILDRLWLR
ncbi:MAG: hypothetical protein AAFZ15_15390 [Bacteroidota bacterium]